MLADSDLYTPAHYAAFSGQLAVLKYLILNCKCDAQAKTAQDTTPLHFAAHYGWLQVVKFLIEDAKCDPDCINSGHETPLHEACKHSHKDIAEYLVDNCNSNILLRNNHGVSALDFLILISEEQHEFARKLLFVAAYDLASVPKPDNLFKMEDTNYTSLYTWGLKSLSGPMLLFESLLSETAKLAFFIQYMKISMRTSESDISGAECTDWNNGSLIVYDDGTQAVIEVSENMSQLLLVMQCVKGREMHLVEKRSFLISAIKERLMPHIETSEFMLLPRNSIQQKSLKKYPVLKLLILS